MEIKKIPINNIKLAKYNPRKDLKPGDIEYEKLKKSMGEFDCVEPLVWNKKTGNLVGGHQRLKILIERGDKEVDVSVVDLDDKKEKALNLALNKISGEWDLPMLKDILEELDVGDFDMEITGFDEDEIEDLMTQFHNQVEEDDYDIEKAVEEVKEPICKYGEIWQLGEHRLMCGDSTKTDDIKQLMDGEQADMVFTDPPYNVNYSGRGKLGKIMNDNMAEENFVEFVMDFTIVMQEYLKTGGVFYMCSGWSSYPIFVYTIKSLGMVFANPIVWVKNNTAMGWNDYKYKYEMIIKGKVKNKRKKTTPILYGWNGGKHYFIDSRFESDVWEIKRRASNTMVHPTQKPIALISRAISNSSKTKEIVLDMFGGSGATLIGCEKLNRKCRINELDPVFCDVIINRWENFTNKKAVKVNI